MSKEDYATETEVNLDSITEEVGQFGWYQCKVLIVAIFVGIFDGLLTNEYVFTTARINSRCLIPECDSAQPEFSPPWILNAVPGTTSASFESCQRFANLTATVSAGNNTCPAELFNRDLVVPCYEHVYENNNTIVYDFNLGCDEWRRSLIGSARTFGNLVSLPFMGYISDRWGRRIALTMNAFNAAWVGVTRYWAATYWGFVMTEFMEAVLGFGAYTCAYILLLELPGTKFRVLAGAVLNTFGSLGQVVLGFMSWGIPYWKHLILAIYVPQLLTIIYYWIMPESIRWYVAKGRIDKAEKALKDLARMNGKELSQKSLEALKRTAEQHKKEKDLQKELRGREPWLVVLVLRHKPVLVRCLVTPVWWITCTFVYYGLTINSVNMSGNSHLNYILVSTVGVPGFWLAMYLSDKFGRKPALIGAYWICAACQIGYILMPEDFYEVSLSLYLVGKLSISVVATVMYVYTGELYPTLYRHRLFAFSSMLGRIGSIVAPLTPALGATVWVNLPFTLFAGLSILSGLLVFITPETLGAKLADTMEEAGHLNRAR